VRTGGCNSMTLEELTVVVTRVLEDRVPAIMQTTLVRFFSSAQRERGAVDENGNLLRTGVIPSPENFGFRKCRTRKDVLDLEMKFRTENPPQSTTENQSQSQDSIPLNPTLYDQLVSCDSVDFLNTLLSNPDCIRIFS
jgi:hypothetical protein